MSSALSRGGGGLWALSSGRAAAVCLALFVFAGYFKGANFLRLFPIDLTLLFAAVTAGFCLLVLWRQRRLPPGSVPMAAVFAALGLGLHWPQDLSSYPVQKELRLFSLTALAAFAPLLLLTEKENRFAFAAAVALLGLVMACAAAMEVAVTGSFTRTIVFNANPILLARASGFAVLLLCVLYWLGHLHVLLFVPATVLALFALLLSGSRGPLVALFAAAAIAAALCTLRPAMRARVALSLGAGGLALVAAVLSLDLARMDPGRRILRLVRGEWGDTEVSRWALWQQTVSLIADSPLGVGWGRFSEAVHVYNDGLLLTYPHNIFLEVTVEAGWFPGILFMLLTGYAVALSLRCAYGALTSGTGDPRMTLVVLGAVTYWLGCALFSGDVNDNRTLWAMIAMALAAQGSWRRGGLDGRTGD